MLSSHDLRNIAKERIKDAIALYRAERYAAAVYTCGYAVEIAVKARIWHTLVWGQFPETDEEWQKYQSYLKIHKLKTLIKFTSIEAEILSKPELEIYADDVVCGHASSVGPLEREHLYYLQSRGLNRVRAERLLIRGFFQEVIDRLPIEGLEEPVSDAVFSRFVAAQEEGRVA